MVDDTLILNELGADINKDWVFKDGDLVVVSGKENLIQATQNRLNTMFGSMDDYYEEYGAGLSRFLGWAKNDTTLKFILLELETCLKQDPRLQNINLDAEYTAKGKVKIYVTVNYNESDEFVMNIVINDDGSIETGEE